MTLRHRLRPLPFATLLAIAGCQPGLDPPCGHGPTAHHDGTVTATPEAPLDRLAAVTRLRWSPAPDTMDAPAFALAAGELGPGQVRDLAEGMASETVVERLIPVMTWRDGADAIIAPTRTLEGDEVYTLAHLPSGQRVALRTRADEPEAVWPRVWPPPDEAANHAVAVWCGAGPGPGEEQSILLQPGALAAHLRPGTSASGQGAGCVHLSVDPPLPPFSDTGPLAPPHAWGDGPGRVPLAPIPLTVETPASPMGALACGAPQVPFGPGCARVEDDRMQVTGPPEPLLWTVTGPGIDAVFTTDADRPDALLLGLPPLSTLTLNVEAQSTGGAVWGATHAIATTAPRARVVLNEVLANPIGPEPAQEWVELYNDGTASASLGGLVLVDIGGRTPLPSATLPPGRFALVVGEDHDPDSPYDPAAADDVLWLSVPRVGAAGLKNQGEPLLLETAGGEVLSRFPAAPKPKAGRSVYRVSPAAPDDDPASFALMDDAATPGAPNPEAANPEAP